MKKEEIQDLIKELIEKTTIPIKQISVNGEDDFSLDSGNKTIWISVEVEQPHYFTGRDGEALSALNHLIRRMIETKMPKDTENPNSVASAVVVDINGFQKRKVENIHAVAHMMAERARYFKSNIEVDPMSAFERRVIHEFLSTANDIKTESTGEGRDRRVVIKYIGTI